MNSEQRYQNCPWYVRLWRRRHYIPIPYYTVRTWWLNRNDEEPLSFRNAWSISTGMAQMRMNWLYDWDEIRQRYENHDARIGIEDQKDPCETIKDDR